ncbi:peptidoglycan-binding protein [Roseomonas sp. BN140053]|uniref:peptidoglycan-binding protein n=1 Tax=Roseomonas sp. BN140053 TaxID=3391898 RepID=UPI0039ED3B1E
MGSCMAPVGAHTSDRPHYRPEAMPARTALCSQWVTTRKRTIFAGGCWPCAARSLVALVVAVPLAAHSQPAEGPRGVALVVGTSAYTSQPAVPACRGATGAVAQALRGLGFTVTERQDPNRSEFDAALASFGRIRVTAPESPAVVYVCGMATEWNGRAFLIPAPAALERDSDTLTQGILARNAADTASRGATGVSLTVLDLTPRPGGSLTSAGFAAAAEGATSSGAALVVGTGSAANLPVTPLAAALRAGLAGPDVELGSLVASLRARLPEAARLAVVAPDGPRFLAGGPAVTPAVPDPPLIAAPAATAPPTNAAVVDLSPAAAPSPPPEEAALNEAQRRRIQASLGVLGHYSGRVDGSFGPETRNAIRRYQASVSAEATGRLTGAQISALIGVVQ